MIRQVRRHIRGFREEFSRGPGGEFEYRFPDLNLRDTQRILHRGCCACTDGLVWAIGRAALKSPHPFDFNIYHARKWVDQQISHYGHRQMLMPLIEPWYPSSIAEREAAEREAAESNAAELEAAEQAAAERELAEREDHRVGEDAPISDGACDNADAASHGGDGNSGEVDHAAQTQASAPREGASAQGSSAQSPSAQGPSAQGPSAQGPSAQGPSAQGSSAQGSSAQGSSAQGASESAASGDAAGDTPDGRPSGQGGSDSLGSDAGGSEDLAGGSAEPARQQGSGDSSTGQGGSGGDEPTQGMDSQQGSGQGSGDGRGCGEPVSAAAAGTDRVPEPAQADEPSVGEAESPYGLATDPSALSSRGTAVAGVLDLRAYLEELQRERREIERVRRRKAARKVVRLLEALIEQECGNGGVVSPRWDGAALARELVSRRLDLARARRRDTVLRDLVVVVDDSPSCASVVRQTLAAALEIAERYSGRVSVLAHANGRDIRLVRPGLCQPWLRRVLDAEREGLEADYYSDRHGNACWLVWKAIARRRPGLVLALGDEDAREELDFLHSQGVKVTMLADWLYDAGHTVLGPVVDLESALAVLEKAVRAK